MTAPPVPDPAPLPTVVLRLVDVAEVAAALGMKRKRPRGQDPTSGAWSLDDARLVAYDNRHGLSVRVERRTGPAQDLRWTARFDSGTPMTLLLAALVAAVGENPARRPVVAA